MVAQHVARVDPRPQAVEAQPLLHGQDQFADAEQADDRDQEADAAEQLVDAEVRRRLPEIVSMPTAASAKPSIIETMVLNGDAPPSPTKLAKARK